MTNLEDGFVSLHRGLYEALAAVSGGLALLATGLATVGIYGVMAFLVSQRTKEIGIRIALGATSHGVTRSVVLQGLRPVFVGMAIGFGAALVLLEAEP